VLALRRGACLATLPVAYFLYVLLSGQLEHILTKNAQFGAMVLFTGLAYELAFWLSAAFALGSLYPYLWGTNGPLKGAVLASVYAGSHAVAALLLGRAGNYLWEVRSFQLLLYLGLLGVWLDYVTLQDKQISGRSLFEYYHIGKAKIVVGYLSPLLITLGVVIRQLYSGETRDAVNQIVTVLSQQIVNLPSP